MTEGTETQTPGRPAAPALPDRNAAPGNGQASRDYWDNVFDQVGRRPLVKIALVLLVLLYASAIYAPLIANDRPYYLSAVDAKEYDSARKGLVGVTSSLRDLAEEGAAGYTKGHADRPDAPPFAEAVRLEENALGLRLDTMRGYLPPARRGDLDAFQKEADALADAVVQGEEGVGERAAALREKARDLRKAYETRREGDPEGKGVELVGRTTWPLFDSVTATEVFLMVLWGLVMTWPVWNRAVNTLLFDRRRDRIRRARKKKWAAALGLSLVAALAWHWTVAGGMTFDVSTYKDRLDSGDIVATRVIFPPIAIGFAETHFEEDFRPPTWTRRSEVDEDGFYLRGPRKPEPDPITGSLPAPSPVDVRFAEPGRNSGWRHLFGTDETGRDLFVRMLYGGRISLTVGLVSTLLLVLIGIVVGSVAGYAGGRTDILLSRIIEIVQSVPAFFLILTAVAIVPPNVLHPIFAIVVFIGIVRWTGVARLVRGEFLKLKEQDFVLAARASGLSPARVVFRHVLPNAMGPVLVAAAFSVAAGILTESAISFLGFGVREPIPSWGSLLSESRSPENWWIQVFPGVAIFVTVLCYNLVGEGVRDALDPRMKL